MNKKIIINTGIFIGELILILVFGYTGSYKIYHFQDWIDKVKLLDFVANNHLIWTAYILPFFELFVALLLCISKTKWVASFLSSGLMAFFTGYIFYKIYIAEDSLCPCGGIFSNLTLDKHLWVNIILLIISISLTIIYYITYKRNNNEKSC
ncbi:MAG: hypothetical protein VB110_04885 [Bacteroidales bacterium]|nr:hypothetical protein [Bacteroidales bacterium]